MHSQQLPLPPLTALRPSTGCLCPTFDSSLTQSRMRKLLSSPGNHIRKANKQLDMYLFSDLSGNDIHWLPADAFGSLSGLQDLCVHSISPIRRFIYVLPRDLSSNHLQAWEGTTFSSASSLVTLFVTCNCNCNWFQMGYCRDLSNNAIRNVGDGDFVGNVNAIILFVFFNLLIEVAIELFLRTIKLVQLVSTLLVLESLLTTTSRVCLRDFSATSPSSDIFCL